MKTSTVKKYECELCGTVYESEEAAKRCESRPVSQDKGAKVGDRVYITGGDGIGEQAIVQSRHVYSREWGHGQWERYWHTVGLTAKMADTWGSRQLTFDDYALIAANSGESK